MAYNFSMSGAYLFTSESVSEGHPDKVADQVSDAVLDALLARDPRARVACETMVKTGVAIVAGEVRTPDGDPVIAQINSSWAVRVYRDELVEFQIDGTHGSAVAGLNKCVAQQRGHTPRCTRLGSRLSHAGRKACCGARTPQPPRRRARPTRCPSRP